MTEKLLSYYKVKGFSSLLVCFAFIFCHMMTLIIRYIGIDFLFGVLHCVHYIEDFAIWRFVISRFCSIHFTVTLAGLKNIIRYSEDFVIQRFVKSRFHRNSSASVKCHFHTRRITH